MTPTDHTPNIRLPLMAPAQAAKHIVHNEALLQLDRLVQMRVESRALTHPPAEAEPGDLYLVPEAATGDWTGHDGDLAARTGTGWDFVPVQAGWIVWVEDEAAAFVITPDGPKPLQFQNEDAGQGVFDSLSVGTGPDASNRISVKSTGVLFSHDDAGPVGAATGDVRFKINKADPSDTASLLFQTGFGGRAEIGTAGSYALVVKVSADGATWRNALEVDGDTGRVSLPATPALTPPVNAYPDSGRFASLPKPSGFFSSGFQLPGYLGMRNGGALSDGGKFIYNNATFGGGAAVLDPEVESFIEATRPPGNSRRFGAEFHLLRCDAGTSPTDSAVTEAGTDYYPTLQNALAALPERFTIAFHVKARSGGVLIAQTRDSVLHVDGVAQTGAVALTPQSGWVHVCRHYTPDRLTHLGYDTILFGVLATSGGAFSLALPCASVGHASPDMRGLVPALEGWV
jgi:hypothetical protein